MTPLTTFNGRTYIGIDLGTTFSAMAYLDGNGQPITIPSETGDVTTPSVSLFRPNGSVVVGHEARLAALDDPERVADCVKRDIGESHYSRLIDGKKFAPEAISALILKKMKQSAELVLGPVHGAVITVPAYFDERRRQATITSGVIAGLDVLDIINEPTAASLAYALRDFILKGGDAEEELRLVGESIPAHNALVYDLGGGTFDVTLLSIAGKRISVLATDGDVYLGGRDWDERIVDYASESFEKEHGSDPRKNPVSYQRLLLAAEQAKHVLSNRDQARIAFSHDDKTLTIDLSKQQFEQMTADLLYRSENRLSRVIKAAKLSWDQIDQILTVGGSTRMPQVLEMIERITGRKANTSLPQDEVVAHGAAAHAAIVLRQQQASPVTSLKPKHVPAPTDEGDLPVIKEYDTMQGQGAPSGEQAPVCGDDEGPLSLVDDELPALIESDQPISQTSPEQQAPKTAAPTLDTVQSGLDDPGDTAGSTAMAIDAQENPNDVTQILTAIKTTNVNAHSLGVALKRKDGVTINSIIIPRNTSLPASITKRYGTNVPNQTTVSVHVIEGDSSLAEECILVGTCRITNLPWGLRKGSTIYVTFSYDNSGRIGVKAIEATSGKSAESTIYREGAMDDQQVDKVKQAVTRISVD
jgi:molecular chaperone DnaK